METIELILGETQELTFEVDITGVTSEKIDVKYVVEADNIEYAFKGKYVNNEVVIDLPILSNILEAKTYESKLVFIVEDKYFEPMHILTEFTQPVSITTSIKEDKKKVVKKQSKKKVSESEISVSTVKVTRRKDIMERMEESLPLMKDATSLDGVIDIYKRDVLLKENHDVDKKDAITFIDSYCKDKYGKTFKEYIA